MEKKFILILFLASCLTCLGFVLVETQFKFLHRVYDQVILDNKGHYLSCAQLPSVQDVNRIVEQHADVVRAIEGVDPGLVGVEVDDFSCPGKADLVIWYASHDNRLEIQALLDGDTFFGIPVRLENR